MAEGWSVPESCAVQASKARRGASGNDHPPEVREVRRSIRRSPLPPKLFKLFIKVLLE
jgi:hypothetical protein